MVTCFFYVHDFSILIDAQKLKLCVVYFSSTEKILYEYDTLYSLFTETFDLLLFNDQN